jgi:hypothetical protein
MNVELIVLVLALSACLLMGLGLYWLATAREDGLKVAMSVMLVLFGGLVGSTSIDVSRTFHALLSQSEISQ